MDITDPDTNYLITNGTFLSGLSELQNQTYGETVHTARRSATAIAIGTIVLASLVLVTVVGNFVVIRAVLTYRQLKEHHSNWFIVNLALADILVNFVSVLSLIALSTDTNQPTPVYGKILCNIQCAMNYCLIVASMLILAFISVDRLVHILYPLHYLDIVNKRRISIMIAWPWLQGMCIGLTPWIANWIHYDYYELVCAIDWSREHALTYVYVAFVTCFMIPLVTLICCYSLIVREITQKTGNAYQPAAKLNGLKNKSDPTKRSTSQLSKQSIPGTANQHKKIIRSLLVVVGVFIICMTPFCVTKVIKVSGQPLPGWVSTMATYVQLAASACNPFIYGIFRREFRVAFRKQYGRLLAKLGLTQRRFEPQHRSTGLHSVTTLRPLAFVRDSTSPLAGDKLNSNSSSSDLSTE